MEPVHRRSLALPVCDAGSAFFQSTVASSIPPMSAAAQAWNRQHSVAAPRADTTRQGRGTPLHNSLSSTAAANQNHRRKSSSSNAIAPSLQIPSSINDSKGSLAEFAAQVRAFLPHVPLAYEHQTLISANAVDTRRLRVCSGLRRR
jgi:hypothetical protein